ncbi:hypothetical protein J4H86_06080 [Spiractinospora alimapuensis]|uniref:hypothetical protein n=1 Tax=Spiractinospora alimapuensis TaxID=2820884 RepID=UPI001F201417|nr:hypothetical protein [Spiractinospora alimapuensis]QVQ53333.1 hypothetical protein J4H86_06080 [Spiractinospora alimapuensis]
MEYTVALIALVAVGVVVVLAMQASRERQRREEYAQWASQYDWEYTPERSDLARQFSGTPFVRGGKVRHVLSGTHRDREVLAFEYSYTTSTGGNPPSSTTHFYLVAAVRLPRARPTLEVTQEHLGHSIMRVFGVDDLQLDNGEFNQAFRISADDDGFARHALDHDVMRWMLNDPRAMETPFRIEGDTLLAWKATRLTIPEMQALIDYQIDLLEQFSQDVWNDGPSPRR